MPYSYPNNVPDAIKNLPAGAQKIFVKVFNSVVKDSDEDTARKAAWAQVKAKYKKKSDGTWTKKTVKEEIVNNSESEGFFKAYIPLKEQNGSAIIVKTEGEGDNAVKSYFLVGEASNTKVDKASDRVTKAFIEKMAGSVSGLNVFAEHEHHIENTLGFIDSATAKALNDGDSLEISTALEPPTENSLVDSILKKMAHGTKMFYSIAGRITKAVRSFDEELQSTVRDLIDGEIYEISLTALPEGNVDFVGAVTKSMNSFISKAKDSDIIVIEDESGDNLVEKITKTLAEMVQSNKIDDQIYDLFYAFRNAIYKITYDSDLTADQKKAKIMEIAGEYGDQVEALSAILADLAAEIEESLNS